MSLIIFKDNPQIFLTIFIEKDKIKKTYLINYFKFNTNIFLKKFEVYEIIIKRLFQKQNHSKIFINITQFQYLLILVNTRYKI